MEDLSVRTSQAEFNSDMNPTRSSPVSAKFMLDFMMPDPFFRSDQLSSINQLIDASPTTCTINNPGTAEACNPRIILYGPLDNTVITNATNGVSLTYAGTVADGHYVVIDIDDSGEYTAVDDLDANVIAALQHSGASEYFILDADDNELSITDTIHTTGTIVFEFYAPYL
jgi:phage-related protein